MKKRRPRILVAVSLGISLGCVVMLFLYASLNEGPFYADLVFRKQAFICTRCGSQFARRALRLFGPEFKSERRLNLGSELSSVDGLQCVHHFRPVGTQTGSLRWNSFKLLRQRAGYPDGDFFYSQPAVQEAISSVAQTNIWEAELMLDHLWRMRERTNVPPPLQEALDLHDTAAFRTALQLQTKGFYGQ